MDTFKTFFDAYVKCFGPLKTVVTPKTPRDMIVGSVDVEGWAEWQLRPCTQDVDSLFSQLEQECGSPFPASFKRWYGAYFTLDMDCSVVRLPPNPSNAPLIPLRKLLLNGSPFATRPRSLGLLPFGDEAMMDAGPLCFDSRDGSDPDRWPIRYWDHEWCDTPQEVGPVIFSSFDKLIEACTQYMLEFAAVKAAMPDEPDAWLDNRQKCIRALMSADPQGAGGPGRQYWETWVAT